ncbi:MAG: hypothetical protein M3680_02020 [Myxococcota bacterium]|nr:hypothetical protein [Myxococcota bacterium]
MIALAARAAAAPPPTGERDPEARDQAADPDDDDGTDDAPSLDAGREVEPARSASEAGAALIEDSLAAASGSTVAELVHDAQLRARGPSRWGRIDLAVAWRSTERDLRRGDEVWLVATWRK